MTKNFAKDQNQKIALENSSNFSFTESSMSTRSYKNPKMKTSNQFSKLQSSKVTYIGSTDSVPPLKSSKITKTTSKLKKITKSDKKSSKSSIIKTREFLINMLSHSTLSPEEKQQITKFPLEYKEFLQTSKNLCHNDINFCFELLKPIKIPYYKFFKKNGLSFPNITKKTTEYLNLCYKFLQNYAHRFLLHSFYNDGPFRKLFTLVCDYFQKISDNPFAIGMFKGTSNIHIMKNFIVGNRVLIEYISQENEYNNWQITTNTKYVVINAVYFAYRNKVIKNIWFQLLSHYFQVNSLVTIENLNRFLLNKEISNSLARRLYNQLLYDVNGVLRGWKGRRPTWQQFLNELRCFRKQFCNELPNSEIAKFIEEVSQKKTFQEISEVLFVTAKDKAPKNNLQENFVDQFIIYCKKKSKYQFKRIFYHYYLGETKKTEKLIKGIKNNSARFNNYNLFQEFLAKATSEFLKENKLSTKQLINANALWKNMIDAETGKHYIHELFIESKPLWYQLIEKIDLKQVYYERLKLWLKRFEEESYLNYSESGDLLNEIEENNETKLNKRVVFQKRKGKIEKNPRIVKNNLKFFQRRRVVPTMIPTSFNQNISNLEKILFTKTFSATPYKDNSENYYSKDNIKVESTDSGTIDIQKIIPCFESYLRSVIDKHIEKIMRESFTRNKSEILLKILKKEQKKIQYPNPTFKSLNFSTGSVGKQLFELDLENKRFTLCLFKKSPKKSIWYNFIIQDEDTPENQRISGAKKRLEQKFYNLELEEYPSNIRLRNNKRMKEPRLKKFLKKEDDNGSAWNVRNPVLVYDFNKQEFILHIPFEKIINDKSFDKTLSKNCNIKLNRTIKEIVIGIDQGISWYAVVTVECITSRYSKNKGGKIIREMISREPLYHYYLNDLEVFGTTFNEKTGLFNNGTVNNSGKFIKRKSNNIWGKGKFRVLRRKIRQRQRCLSTIQNQKIATGTSIQQLSSHPYFNDLILASYWEKFQRVQKTLATNLAGKIRDITVYFQTVYKSENPTYRDCPIRVQVEYLKWINFEPKYNVGYFLSHQNIHFIYSQFQDALGDLLIEHGIGLWAVNPRNSSKLCSICHYPEKGYRTGKKFYCSNPQHCSSKGKSYSCNADLNAARNISLFPPLTLQAVNLAKT